MARPGGLGADSPEVAQYPGCPSQTGREPSLPGRQLRAWQKGGEDIAYGWKGKGSTVHLVTEGNGLPLAFLVTAANVSEVTVGLQVVDQVRVPQPQGRPRRRPASLAADKTVPTSDGSFTEEGFSRPFQGEDGKTAAVGQADLRWCIQLARVAGR